MKFNWKKKYEGLHVFIEMFMVATCIFLIISGLWAVDIGASGMIIESQIGVPITAGNGWTFRSSMQQYHIGLYIIAAGMFMLVVLAFALIWENIKLRRGENSFKTQNC